ncbi:sarcosine oxidase / L-pipecolate oxidase [Thermosporothrix hazakensis]|uniref:Sarcosine oxidase / L-pipecolate oxidase n=1 Tax=Thermosporothrix hazakensis TaxID=644383 RepID=A0A326UDA9_THEHA|nr:FAD-dependent oxidoreductase [Thermosporothrix hazakensis]PZW36468.1 sarcosine oxidase / L-pipecolate oxidase [Thermosporothrix hazakensis]GCE47123.1 N-methyltryptophan oxidase [Thermosporothrix hazakensis]
MFRERFVIVGAGIVGLAAAYALLRQGKREVTVLEQATVAHQRATSSGLSRLLRFEYGMDTFYPQMVQLSLQRWHELEHSTGRTLYTRTGMLVLGHENDPSSEGSYHSLKDLGLPIQRISSQTCRQRFPQFQIEPFSFLTYNIEAGMLYASKCLHTLRDAIRDLGGTIVPNTRVTHFFSDQPLQPIRLITNKHDTIYAEKVILATGPWVQHLLGSLQLPIRITRQYVLYFTGLPISPFALNSFPAFMADDLYGMPIHNTCQGDGPAWLKATSHSFGTPIDPDEPPNIDPLTIEHITTKLQHLIPLLQNATLAHVDTCMYDVSPDEDFILDFLPDDPRIVFATGLTGHGFKFGLLLGEILSNMVLDREPIIPLQRFQVSRFAQPRVHAGLLA